MTRPRTIVVLSTLFVAGAGLALGACRPERESATDASVVPDAGHRLRTPTEDWRRLFPETESPERDDEAGPVGLVGGSIGRVLPIEAWFFQPETVCEPDERTLVSDASADPWNRTCRLIIRLNDDSLAVGTGWVLGPRLVVTAGHCVHEGAGGRYFKSVTVLPGSTGAEIPFGGQVSERLRAASNWIQLGALAHDYGAILLDEPLDVRIRPHTAAPKTDEALRAGEATLSGYPADKEGGRQWVDRDPIQDVRPRRLRYRLDTFGGQSGAALLHGDVVVGIHNYGGCPNAATRITPTVMQDLERWRAESEAPGDD